MRLLITGGGGQLGRELQRAFEGTNVRALSHGELDVTEGDRVMEAFQDYRPTLAIHAAALTNTSLCESQPTLAMSVNATGTQNVARACEATKCALVYISTNEVFDGTKTTPYGEMDDAAPINEYGRSKRQGELLALETTERCYAVRTSWLYGAGADNFVSKVLRWSEASKTIAGVTDEISGPTWTRDLAGAIARLVESDQYGIYHLANTGEASRYYWATEILRMCGRTDVDVEPVTTEEQRSRSAPDAVAPKKPPYSVLGNNSGIALGVGLRDWQEALGTYLTS